MSHKNRHNLLLSRALQYLGIILIAGAIGGGYWYWKNARASVAVNTSQNTSLTNGLVGLWSFDGADVSGTTAYDRSGQGNNGTLVNGPTPVVGKVGQGLGFTGSGARYVSPSVAPAVSSTGSFTYSIWINPSTYTNGANTDGAGTYFFDRTTATNNLVSLKAVSSNYAWQSRNNAGTNLQVIPTTSGITVNTWTHIVLVREFGIGYRIYKNGVLEGSSATGASDTLTPPIFSLGRSVANNSGDVTGTLDEFRIYSRALSATEISDLYRQGTATVNASRNSELTNGLVGLWPFNGADVSGTTAYDRSSNSNNGTLTNGPTATIGKLGQALSFDGTNDYVQISDHDDFTASGSLTVSQWVRADTLQAASAARGWLTTKGTTSNYEWAVYTVGDGTDAKFRTNIWNTTANPWLGITGTTVIATDTWYHVVMTFDQTTDTLDIYVNGTSEGSTNTASGTQFLNGTSPVRIGARGDGASYFFDGQIDEVRVYNRALSAAEISDLYRQGTATVNASRNSELTNGLVGLWPFNGADVSGTTAYDRSGSGNNGTLVNGPTPVVGKVGQGMSFDGTDDHMTAGNGSSLGITGPITVSAWFKADTIPTGSDTYSGVIAKGYDGTNTGYQFGFQNDPSTGNVAQFLWASYNGSSHGTGYTYGSNVTAGNWYHAVGTHDGSVWKLYFDGTLVASTADSTGPVSTTKSLLIGALDLNGTVHEFDGSIDEVRVYNRALSATEISALYYSGR